MIFFSLCRIFSAHTASTAAVHTAGSGIVVLHFSHDFFLSLSYILRLLFSLGLLGNEVARQLHTPFLPDDYEVPNVHISPVISILLGAVFLGSLVCHVLAVPPLVQPLL